MLKVRWLQGLWLQMRLRKEQSGKCLQFFPYLQFVETYRKIDYLYFSGQIMQRFFTIASTSVLAAIALITRANMVPVNSVVVFPPSNPPALSTLWVTQFMIQSAPESTALSQEFCQ
ncbi:MAG: hypothetical protein F6K30_04205 [Cyanothece sp. SIO2G6]|nr:hypothetical protein [Cyanothece sp. SIO2G6]